DVPGKARQHGPHGARSRGRQDAPLPDPHPSRRPRPGRALALRPGPGPNRVSPPLRAAVRELELIERLEQLLRSDRPRVLRGLGDDAAVVRAGAYAVTSVDTMVDGVHFRLGQLLPEEIGHRALAAAISDLAAMGASPGEAYLALGLPEGSSEEDAV